MYQRLTITTVCVSTFQTACPRGSAPRHMRVVQVSLSPSVDVLHQQERRASQFSAHLPAEAVVHAELVNGHAGDIVSNHLVNVGKHDVAGVAENATELHL